MATRTQHHNGNLEEAMAMLLQNQVALAAQHTRFQEQWAQNQQQWIQNQQQWIQNQQQWLRTEQQINERWVETQKIFARIDKELDAIKAVLIRHEAILERLPEAIRDKIGFKGQ